MQSSNPVLKKIYLFTQDLLDYNEDLLHIGRTNEELENSTENKIAFDSTSNATRISSSKSFDGDAEIMTLSTRWSQTVTLSFFGNDAYDVVDDFINMQLSQLAYELQYQNEITVKLASDILDIKLLTGSTYVNRLDISLNVLYNKKKEIAIRRLDELQQQLFYNN